LNERKKVTVIPQQEEQIESEDRVPDDEERLEEGETPASEYDYLLSMPLWNLTDEKIEELKK
jgi:hypothetical protein